MMNSSGIHPVGEKILVQWVETERTTKGGIVIPEPAAEKRDIANVKARVIEIGPLAFEAERDCELKFGRTVRRPVEGEMIAMARYAGYDIKGRDGRKYRIIKDDDVTAILDEDVESVEVIDG